MPDLHTLPEGHPEPLLSTAEAAELAGLTKYTLVSYRSAGKGPPFVKGKSARVWYRRTDILAWLAEQPSEDADLVDSKEAARITGYSVKHLQNLRCCGGGPPFLKMKGQRGCTDVYYRREDVVAWRDAR